MRVALINTNRMRPPIAPIGLEYVGEALIAAGHTVDVLDLCWAADPTDAVARFLAAAEYRLVGLTLRNTDDCSLGGRSFLADFAASVRAVRRHSDALLVAGGIGFSVMPEVALEASGADAGIWGEGEFALPELAHRLERGEDWRTVPGLVRRQGEAWRRNPPAFGDLETLPPFARDLVDGRRYFAEGGQAGIETKRGCPCHCIYCADPVAKGATVRMRPPAAVAGEIERLLARGIDHVHTCDAEFNQPQAHALAVCREMADRGLGERLRWYAYCSPAPFSPQLATAMARAGCAGINFGADSGDAAMLRRLGRAYGPDAIVDAVRHCREAGMAVMLDLLLGGPGETAESIARTISLVKQAAPDRAGISLGLRVYPGTPLAAMAERGQLADGLSGDATGAEPLFYLEPALAATATALIERLVAGDERFLFLSTADAERSYNYNANEVLEAAIRKGHRGAYWDILRRRQAGSGTIARDDG